MCIGVSLRPGRLSFGILKDCLLLVLEHSHGGSERPSSFPAGKCVLVTGGDILKLRQWRLHRARVEASDSRVVLRRRKQRLGHGSFPGLQSAVRRCLAQWQMWLRSWQISRALDGWPAPPHRPRPHRRGGGGLVHGLADGLGDGEGVFGLPTASLFRDMHSAGAGIIVIGADSPSQPRCWELGRAGQRSKITAQGHRRRRRQRRQRRGV